MHSIKIKVSHNLHSKHCFLIRQTT